MWYCRFQVANSKSSSLLHDPLPPVLSPSCGHGGFKGRFLCRKDKPSWLRQISTSEVGDRGGELWEVESGRHCPAHCASSPCGVYPNPSPLSQHLQTGSLEESELDIYMSDWLNFRRLNFIPVSGVVPFPRSVGSHRGSMSMLLLDVFGRSRAGEYTCKSGLASGHTRDHLCRGKRGTWRADAKSWHFRAVVVVGVVVGVCGTIPVARITHFHPSSIKIYNYV